MAGGWLLAYFLNERCEHSLKLRCISAQQLVLIPVELAQFVRKEDVVLDFAC
jgi:hypothetical protein